MFAARLRESRGRSGVGCSPRWQVASLPATRVDVLVSTKVCSCNHRHGHKRAASLTFTPTSSSLPRAWCVFVDSYVHGTVSSLPLSLLLGFGRVERLFPKPPQGFSHHRSPPPLNLHGLSQCEDENTYNSAIRVCRDSSVPSSCRKQTAACLHASRDEPPYARQGDSFRTSHHHHSALPAYRKT